MELKAVNEAILFASPKPLSVSDLTRVLKTAAQADDPEARAFAKPKAREIEKALEALAAEHEEAARSFRLVCVAGAWQFVTRPDYAPWLQALMGEKPRPARLSQPALETLTIIAYRQPLTRAEIEQIRGVSVDGVMQTLMERGLIEQVGRADTPGRPMRYGTTALFLDSFGLRDLSDLPAADELRRLAVEQPPELVTPDPGLATAPPDTLAEGEVPAEKTAAETQAEPADMPSEASADPGAAEPAEAGETSSAEATPDAASAAPTKPSEPEPEVASNAAPDAPADPAGETTSDAPEAVPSDESLSPEPASGAEPPSSRNPS
jgi:segregation and condensation protein B